MTKWINTTALYHVTTECMACGYEDVVGVPIVNIPEVRALVDAAREVLYDLGAPATWRDVCPEHHRQLITALAPFDSPAPPTTLVDSSGRYEVKRD